MNRSILNQQLGFEPRFITIGHAHQVVGRIMFAPEQRQPKPGCLLLDYKGALASDKAPVHDIAARAAANRAYKKQRGASQAWADEWMAKHAAVYPMFVRFALEVAAVRSRFSAKAIVERQRWETTVLGGKPSSCPTL